MRQSRVRIRVRSSLFQKKKSLQRIRVVEGAVFTETRKAKVSASNPTFFTCIASLDRKLNDVYLRLVELKQTANELDEVSTNC